jgi:hypothetical protein
MKQLNKGIVEKLLSNWQKWIVTAALIVFLICYGVVKGGAVKTGFITLWFVMIGVVSFVLLETIEIISKKNKVSGWYLTAIALSGGYVGYLYLNVEAKYIVAFLILCTAFPLVFFVLSSLKNNRS